MIVIKRGPVMCELGRGDPKKIIPALRVKDPSLFFTFPPHIRKHLPKTAFMTSFFDEPTRTFPFGLLRRVKRRLKRKGLTFKIVGPAKPEPAPITVSDDCLFDITMRPDQVEDANTIIRAERGCMSLATNYGKTVFSAAVVINLFEHFQKPCVVIVPTTTLVRQTAADYKKYFGGRMSVGMIGDKSRTFGDVTFVTAQSAVFASKPYVDARNAKVGKKGGHKRYVVWNEELWNLLQEAICLIVDEGHKGACETYAALLKECPARYRFGMSGSMESKNKSRDMALRAYLGPIVKERKNKEMIDRGISANVLVAVVADRKYVGMKIKAPKKKKVWKFSNALGCRVRRKIPIDPRQRFKLEKDKLLKDLTYNRGIATTVRTSVRGGLKPLILTTSLPQMRLLKGMLEGLGLSVYEAHGKVPAQTRLQRVKAFAADPKGVLIGNEVFDEGLNALAVGAVFLASGGDSIQKIKQRIGRGIRNKLSGLNWVLIFDFYPLRGEYTLKHAKNRIAVYKKEGFEVLTVSNLLEFRQKVRGNWKGIFGERRFAAELEKQKRISAKR